jgi:enoyl-CoA hydratase/carnithine racemase
VNSSKHLLLREDENVLEVTLNRPHVANALSGELVQELRDVLGEASGNGTSVLVLRGAGRNFCGGFDLGGDVQYGPRFVPGMDVTTLLEVETLLNTLYTAPFATVVCLHGSAVGAGADLAVACDYVVAMQDARVSFPGFRAGVSLGTRRLLELVGRRHASDLLLRGAVATGPLLMAYGLVTHLVDTRKSWESSIEALVAEVRLLEREPQVRFNSIAKNVSGMASIEDLQQSLTSIGTVHHEGAGEAQS